MTAFLRSLKADLLESRTRAVLGLLAAALVGAVAYAVLGGGSSAPPPPAPPPGASSAGASAIVAVPAPQNTHAEAPADRKSTRLNSSHQIISYAVFCLKKKKT